MDFWEKIRDRSSPKYLLGDSVKTSGPTNHALCYTNYLGSYETPKYFPFFFRKRENLGFYIAQKTPKNKCLNLFEKEKCKVDFWEKIRGISSPKYLLGGIL